MIVTEEFLSNCHARLVIFIRERDFKTVDEITAAADNFMEAQRQTNLLIFKEKVEPNSRTSRDSTPGSKTQVRCFLCDKAGHEASDCTTRPKQPYCMVCRKKGHDAQSCRRKNPGDREVSACCMHLSRPLVEVWPDVASVDDEKSSEDALEHLDLETASALNPRTVMRAPAKTSLVSALLLATVFFASVLFSGSGHHHSYGVMRRQWRTPAPRSCGSESCSRLAALLAGAMNRSARPCDNFHDYVCRGWLQGRSVSVAQEMRDTLVDKVSHWARSMQVPDLHQTSSGKAARYFTACDDVVSASEDHLGEVKELLRKGSIMWPDVGAKTDLLDAIFYMSIIVRVPVVFEMSFNLKKVSIFNTMALFNILTTHEQTPLPDLNRRFTGLFYQHRELFALLNAALSGMKQEETRTARLHEWTKSVSENRWQAAFFKYFKIFKNESVPVVVDSKAYFLAAFVHYKKFGPQKTTDLYGYLCV
ncbi:hypothetical protein V5799_024241 [Amblyomma americanum]|uniref:CCHC-type domain-containing protein n=1 Tax=Amblyomma americanum TaxID=6943 RepID=A0AAQ4ECM9_AMBAM